MYETAIMGHLLVGLRSVFHSVILERERERETETKRETERERGIYTNLMVHSKT